MMGPSALSTQVVNRALRTVPYPLLGENTLVLSDSCILAPDDEGNLSLMFRQALANKKKKSFFLVTCNAPFLLHPGS